MANSNPVSQITLICELFISNLEYITESEKLDPHAVMNFAMSILNEAYLNTKKEFTHEENTIVQ